MWSPREMPSLDPSEITTSPGASRTTRPSRGGPGGVAGAGADGGALSTGGVRSAGDAAGATSGKTAAPGAEAGENGRASSTCSLTQSRPSGSLTKPTTSAAKA
jgi:hypothetical protein